MHIGFARRSRPRQLPSRYALREDTETLEILIRSDYGYDYDHDFHVQIQLIFERKIRNPGWNMLVGMSFLEGVGDIEHHVKFAIGPSIYSSSNF